MPETWATYRHALAERLGWHLYTNQSTSAGSGAANTLVIPDLIDTNLESNFLDTTWEYQPSGGNAGEVRRVLKGGLAPATGTVTLSRAHTAATSSATAIEFYGVLPPVRSLGRKGLLDAANEALAECWAIDTLTVAANSTAYQYPLTAYPWLSVEDQVIDVYIRRLGEVRDTLLPQWRWINDVDTPQLEVPMPLNSGDVLKPVVYRPMDTWLQVNSTWTDTATGLLNETDQGLLSVNGMVVVGLYYCYEFLATEGDVSQRAQWRTLADRQRMKANNWKDGALPTLQGRDVHAGHGPASLVLIGNGVSFDAGNMDF